ncbi:Hypothetical protein NAEGRDRAFT_72637 [Naegleria gruberi]|uniref:Uncharacterized protein n=1 Tax=Naegleria gruberi TaxID=5762 RepID=D2VU23_NAEGR|nr:uncharacterized protein NAEGRDRAFT_72637 [Naegleria gruberi]EFC39614.1 Hypothetical protein NAEGRDRAFT_72637 [Naegleria gruberi]|eukprot:XP_002672358.1 Hypothetical protein NAEGRDRAFT_72637 [Naegleria gruberi strain NEG-M]
MNQSESSSVLCFRPSNHDTMMRNISNDNDEKLSNSQHHPTTIIDNCASILPQQKKKNNVPTTTTISDNQANSPANNTIFITTTTSTSTTTTTNNNESVDNNNKHCPDDKQLHHQQDNGCTSNHLHEQDMSMKTLQAVFTKKDKTRTTSTKHVVLIASKDQEEEQHSEEEPHEDASSHHTIIHHSNNKKQQQQQLHTITFAQHDDDQQHNHAHTKTSLSKGITTPLTSTNNTTTSMMMAGNYHQHVDAKDQSIIISDDDNDVVEQEGDVETFDDESSLGASFRHKIENSNGTHSTSFSFHDELSLIEVSSPTDMTTQSTPSFDSSTSNQSALSSSLLATSCVITKLDDDTIGVILSYCSIPEFENLTCTCRSFYNKFHLSYIYRQVFKKLNSKNSNKKSSRHYKSNHLQITPYLREVLRNRYHPTIFVPIRCMQFNAYTRFKDAIIDFWVKEFGFKRLNDAEVEIDIDFSKSNPWIDHLEKIVIRNRQDQQSESTIPRTISQLEILKKDQAFLKPILNERKNSSRTLSPFGSSKQQNSDMPTTSNVLSDLLKTIIELRQSGSVLRQQTVSNKFTDPNELDISDSQRVALNGAKSLIVANHWRVFDKFTLHIDFQFPSHERHFSFVEMPEITMYYHNFRSADGNPRKDLIEVSSGSIFKDGVDGKVFEFDSLGETGMGGTSPMNTSYQPVPSPSNSMSATVGDFKKPPKFTPVNGNSPYPSISHGTNPFTSITQPPKKKSRFFKKSSQATAVVGKVLLYFILHDFCPRYFSDYFSPKLASLESKAQQTKLQYLMKYYEKEDPNVVIDYLTINRNQLKQYRNKMIRKHTTREARRHMVKDNCMSMVRNFAKLVPFINYDQMTNEQKTYLLKTMVFNHVNPQDFLSMSDQLFMSSSFFGELRFNPTINSPFQINIMPRKCQTRDEPRPVWDYMINDQESDNASHSSLMSTADEIEYDSFQIYFDTMYTDTSSSAFSITGLDMPAINSEKIVVQRHILEIPTKFMMRCVTYHTPKNNAKNDLATTSTSSRSISSMFKAFCGVFCCGGDKMSGQ